jgi:hypothetical protein
MVIVKETTTYVGGIKISVKVEISYENEIDYLIWKAEQSLNARIAEMGRIMEQRIDNRVSLAWRLDWMLVSSTPLKQLMCTWKS